jgi:hypothetical protein
MNLWLLSYIQDLPTPGASRTFLLVENIHKKSINCMIYGFYCCMSSSDWIGNTFKNTILQTSKILPHFNFMATFYSMNLLVSIPRISLRQFDRLQPRDVHQVKKERKACHNPGMRKINA